MPDGYRTVFNLYHIEGYSHKEIAEMLGITESTSKTQLMKSKSYARYLLTNEIGIEMNQHPLHKLKLSKTSRYKIPVGVEPSATVWEGIQKKVTQKRKKRPVVFMAFYCDWLHVISFTILAFQQQPHACRSNN